jgi:hypothetical protein
MLKTTSTSKKLTWVLTIFYMASIIAIGIARIKWNINLTDLLNYILPLESIIIVSYFSKSGIENINKIKTGTNTDNFSETNKISR